MRVLVTGAAGFIGYHLTKRLLDTGFLVTGIDNLNDYYSVQLKKDRLNQLLPYADFTFHKVDLADALALEKIFTEPFDYVVNMAAQAGVRYSLINPQAYIQSNLVGIANLLEACRHHPVRHLVCASSSSIYGLNTSMPFSTRQHTNHPASLYAATKKSGELMAHSYSHLYGIPCTELRFFTVYGPWGRPDMALDIFTKAILENRPITLFNQGHMRRDFTYVDDIVEGVIRVMEHPATPDPTWNPENPNPNTSSAPWRLYNIGNDNPINLGDFITILENALGKKAIRQFLPMQAGDIEATWADVNDLRQQFGFSPATPLEEGIQHFVQWFRDYYKL